MNEQIRHELRSITDIPGATRDRRVLGMVEFVVGHVERAAIQIGDASVDPSEIPRMVDEALMEHLRFEIRAHREADDADW